MVSRSVDEIVSQVQAVAESGDHVLVMSNGGFGGIHEKLLEGLANLSAVVVPLTGKQSVDCIRALILDPVLLFLPQAYAILISPTLPAGCTLHQRII